MIRPRCGFTYSTGKRCDSPSDMAYATVLQSGAHVGRPKYRCEGHSDTWHLSMKVRRMSVEEAVVLEVLDS